ncbi:MAG: DUF2177 family protein [Proteobacteria bacterium]|nr:DUF2177 family protein [Pseudomonadota bacterium]
MVRIAVAYGAALLALGALDGVWLGLIAKDFYRAGLGALMAERVNLWAAAVFYLLYPIGLVIFVVRPALDGAALSGVLWRGALFGLFAYATYDLTNLATLKDFPAKVALVDMAWGAVASAIACTAAFYAASLIRGE